MPFLAILVDVFVVCSISLAVSEQICRERERVEIVF